MQVSRLVDSRVLVPSVQRVMAEHMPQLAGGRGLRLDDAASATSMAAFDGAAYTARAVRVCACICARTAPAPAPTRTTALVLAISRRGHRPDDGMRLGDRLLHPSKQRPPADARARD